MAQETKYAYAQCKPDTHLDSFVEAGISSGRFSNGSEVVREGLRLLEQCEAEDRAKLEWLRSATQEAFAAFDHGKGIPLSSVKDIDTLMQEVMPRAMGRARSGTWLSTPWCTWLSSAEILRVR